MSELSSEIYLPSSLRRPALFSELHSLKTSPPNWARSMAVARTAQASPSLWRNLDRIQVLGDRSMNGYGHRGCINALSWSQDGETLISSGDDCRLCIWKHRNASTVIHPEEDEEGGAVGLEDEHFTTNLILRTGHTGNVFNCQFLPHTSDMRIVTCAADKEVRVFDLARPGGAGTGDWTTKTKGRVWEERPEAQCCIRVLDCHYGRVKKIVTEDSPDRFLTVSEDHSVRQHDLRVPHRCRTEGCPAALVRLPYSTNAIACSPMTPFYFVVAGRSSFGHLFDRRMVGRVLKHEWGQDLDEDDDSSHSYEVHVSGARMSKTNGRELLLSYMGDGAYLYNIHDDPQSETSKESSVVGPNEKKPRAVSEPLPAQSSSAVRQVLAARKRRKLANGSSSPSPGDEREAEDETNEPTEGERSGAEEEDDGPEAGPSTVARPSEQWDGIGDEENDSRTQALRNILADVEMALEDHDDDQESDDDIALDDLRASRGSERGPGWEAIAMPIVLPRRRFAGMSNVETVKDVNFLGPNDEYVASGSDDGNFFIWNKDDAEIVGIWEGDGSVVNVIEDRPSHYPLLAVSGIDDTVKLFGPSPSPYKFSRLSSSAEILRQNARISRGLESAIDITYLAANLRARNGGECIVM